MTDLLVIGDVRTMDPRCPRAAGVAIRAGRVVALGDWRQLRRQLPAGTPELAPAGAVVLPGFVDSHIHLMWAGRAASRVALADATGIGEIQARISRYAAAHPGRSWIEADAGFDPPDLAERRLPTATELEAAAPGRPLLLDRKGHDALVNLTGLRYAGITAATPDPPGGRIDRDPQGMPTGLLVEHPAVALVRAVVPAPDLATRVGWIVGGQRELLRHGITTAVDPAVAPADLAAYAQAERTGELAGRTVVMPLGDDQVSDADLRRAVAEAGLAAADPAWLRVGPTKLFLDGGGSLGTALRSVPWPGTDGYHGHQSLRTSTLRAHCAAAAAAGRGVGVHAVGDAAVALTLSVLADVDRRTPVAGKGFHVIHAYLGPTAAAMAAARRLAIGVSAHPALQWHVGRDLLTRLGEPAAAAANPLRSWLDAGVLVGGGSDAPGPPVSVLHGMWQARTRRVRGRDEPLGPGQAVTAEEALALFTTGAGQLAAAGRPGAGSGTLYPGGPGDLAILDVDPLTPEPSALLSGRVVATVVAGVVSGG
ncbi:amidohydrolase family protein [Natronosporangium hydrolyticum]|uniref:Amidohydrolase family protein n=1 Tax=Natronosporangium hydrolyticum TaxID=2811111 RepID=A0A895YPL2_9ACTN|nr:amidohydrolase family protein [Natronosporangium hydrolyticum]QSB15898.1 amidohydrolase family protein [Natronosporangium hydrolyticum]